MKLSMRTYINRWLSQSPILQHTIMDYIRWGFKLSRKIEQESWNFENWKLSMSSTIAKSLCSKDSYLLIEWYILIFPSADLIYHTSKELWQKYLFLTPNLSEIKQLNSVTCSFWKTSQNYVFIFENKFLMECL